MGRSRNRGRAIDGIFILDKPSGESSNRSLQRVKRLYNARKAGHTGSLDSLATGVLPICLGEATKFSHFFLEADKSYTSTILLGVVSDTEDIDGKMEALNDPSVLDELSDQQIEDVLANMHGEQWQIPPMYSALKYNGQRLYHLARQGIEVKREPRLIRINEISLKAIRRDQVLVLDEKQIKVLEIDIAVSVTKGTYVRTIAATIGEKLGVGGIVAKLRRTAVSLFSLEQAISLPELEKQKLALEDGEEDYSKLDDLLVPIAEALPQLPSVVLDENSSFYLLRGNPVQVSGSPLNGQVKILLETGQFVGVGEIDDNGRVAPKRLVAL